MRNILLGAAGVLFLVAFAFAVTADPFRVDVSGSDMPNALAAATVLGFALAGGAALLAAAVVHCFDRFEGDRDDINTPGPVR
jgi:hypothetical protein